MCSPEAGFETDDFVKEKLKGAYRQNDTFATLFRENLFDSPMVAPMGSWGTHGSRNSLLALN